MSAGSFIFSRYETDEGDIFDIKVQPETLTLSLNGATNTAPTGAVDGTGSVNVSGSLRQNGVNARRVRFRFSGEPPTGYKPSSVISLPILQQSVYETMTATRGATGTYLGAAIQLVGGTKEKIN